MSSSKLVKSFFFFFNAYKNNAHSVKKGEPWWLGFASQTQKQVINAPLEHGRAGRGVPTAAKVRRQTSVVTGSG